MATTPNPKTASDPTVTFDYDNNRLTFGSQFRPAAVAVRSKPS
jgi:hypothetical protein